MNVFNRLLKKFYPEKEAPESKFRVAVVSNTPLFRKALSTYLSEMYTVLLSVSNNEEVMSNLNATNLPDFILIDIDRNLEDSILICTWLKQHYPSVKVVAVTIDSDREPVDKMLASGADGYFLKTILLPQIKTAFKQIARGKIYLAMPLELLYTTYVSKEQLLKIARRHGLLDRFTTIQ